MEFLEYTDYLSFFQLFLLVWLCWFLWLCWLFWLVWIFDSSTKFCKFLRRKELKLNPIIEFLKAANIFFVTTYFYVISVILDLDYLVLSWGFLVEFKHKIRCVWREFFTGIRLFLEVFLQALSVKHPEDHHQRDQLGVMCTPYHYFQFRLTEYLQTNASSIKKHISTRKKSTLSLKVLRMKSRVGVANNPLNSGVNLR